MIWLSPWWLNQYDVHTCSNSNAFSELHSHFHRFLSVLYRQNCLISLVKNCTARKEMIYFGQLSKRKSLNYQIPRGIRSCYCGTMRDGDESVLIWAVKLTIKGKKKKDRVFHLCREGMRGQKNPCHSTTVWNLPPQHHKNHCFQGHQWTIWNMCLFLNSPLQVCSS